uniref:Creatine kinase M-type n=1 Tax=Leptobrachium leishanense TaxID=445787 RepID=A0A8C5QJD8_9ANUR
MSIRPSGDNNTGERCRIIRSITLYFCSQDVSNLDSDYILGSYVTTDCTIKGFTNQIAGSPLEGLSSWTGDYKPRFYSLNGKTEKEQQIFINELFKYDELPDQGLPDCQISFWFPGPGVWINRDKSFLLWTDGGKRVSITSTQKGGNMKEVLKRFYIGQLMTEELFKKPEQPLTWNDNLGEGLTCSSRLGTKFEVGVNTRFPNLRNQPSFPHILKTQNLQKKDTEGLCSHIIYGTIDRLFSLEFQEILTKFESLIQMEKKLENGEGIKDLPS